jgi:hypothetical protein
MLRNWRFRGRLDQDFTGFTLRALFTFAAHGLIFDWIDFSSARITHTQEFPNLIIDDGFGALSSLDETDAAAQRGD